MEAGEQYLQSVTWKAEGDGAFWGLGGEKSLISKLLEDATGGTLGQLGDPFCLAAVEFSADQRLL
ncbi:hypothetical protein M527_13795 [Sphingobium indicum IP26]|nr:hypothetical protein M527_13795 [Sphingobium indicum IP26]